MKNLLKLILLFFLVIQLSCNHYKSNINQKIKDLEQLFNLIEKYQVKDFRNQDWCKNINYIKGKYAKTSKESTCILFEGETKEFNKEAEEDFNLIARELEKTKADVLFFSIKLENNKIATAEFNINCGFCRPSYVYEPNYKLPENMGQEMIFSRIDNNWYLVEEDWN
ncbi:MAG: hypothetical protein IPK14_15290 [Blastocatellia bacterium]|nr:hypothetical protein [Blastocatellia bacterium]